MKHLSRMALILVFGAGFALAQTGMQNPPSTPPTFPTQQQPTMQHPDENSGQSAAASPTALPKAQADIQSALRRQLPASADSVTVSATDDNKIQLSGTVTSDTEKNQIEQIARSAAPDLTIVNKLKVSNLPPGPGTVMQPTTAPPNNPEGKTGTEGKDKTSQPNTSRQPMPPMGSGFMAQTGAAASADAQGNIQKALQQDPNLANANITVTVKNNVVDLSGTVANKDQKKTAKHIAVSNAGGLKVVDHLKVESENPTPQKY